MTHEDGLEIKLHAGLLALDEGALERVRRGGCERCGGRLHVAHYPRKARGLSAAAEAEGRYGTRLSLCCGREGCRRRSTPPSVRFLGPKVYVALVLVLVGLVEGERAGVVTTPRAPSWATRRRHRAWWQCTWLSSPWFAELAARLTEPVSSASLPGSLLSRFQGAIGERVTHLLCALAPWTTGSLPPERSRLAMVR